MVFIILGSDVNAISNIIGTPLHMACSEGVSNRSTIMQILLENKAEPNLVVYGVDGSPIKPPLAEYLCNDEPEYEIVSLLLKYGAEVSK